MKTFKKVISSLFITRLGLGGLVLAVALMAAGQAEARYASIVIDFETGQVLHEKNADTRNYPASLVKMMTLYLAFEALERGDLTMNQKLKASRRAGGMPASKLGLKRGETITVKDAILALVTKSANDAAVVIAEALAKKETKFAQLMTKKARALGMRRTNFRNASGLPNRRQMSTARDMATLARALIRDFPGRYKYFSTKHFTYKGRKHRNHNRLLRHYDGADGIKTGYIRASGFNLVASAVRDGRRIIAVVFGGKTPRSRDRHAARLMDRAFVRLASNGIERIPGPPRHKPEFTVMAKAGTSKHVTAPKPAKAKSPAPAVEMGSTEKAALDRGYGIQVGAYYRYSPAKRAAQAAVERLPDILDEARVMVSHINGRRGRIYRARLVGLTESTARQACEHLSEAKVDCLVVRTRARLALKDRADGLAHN